jgi:DNA-binding transcriptional ArsR family regulator
MSNEVKYTDPLDTIRPRTYRMAPSDTKDYRLRIDTSGGDDRPRFEVVVRSEAVFDVMLAMWSAFGGDEMAKEHEVGKKFFTEFRKAVPAEALAEMERAGLDDGSTWATILTYVASRAPIGDDDMLIAWLRGTDDDIAGAILCELAWKSEPDDLEAAVETRDPDAIDTVLGTVKEYARRCLSTALQMPVGEMGPSMARVLTSVMGTAYAARREQWAGAIAASAESTRRLAATLDPHDLIERVTNGLAYQIPLGARRLVLVPTVTLRPWTLITDFGDSVVVAYAVADEHLDHDPDAAPGWLVRFHKALGDEKRLRILREVADGGATLSDLTQMLGLAKSTVFHHMGILRAAGLVRVVFGQNDDGVNTYHLRSEAFADADTQLQKYLEVILVDQGARS